jgi:hypothetical protein
MSRASRIISHTWAACKAVLGRTRHELPHVVSSVLTLLGNAGDGALLQKGLKRESRQKGKACERVTYQTMSGVTLPVHMLTSKGSRGNKSKSSLHTFLVNPFC